ncbi:protein disulfide-isomerase precursor [Linderina macrospora]|uniref:Protein disulfide-isomerase n=1 Tax=Linderina macrospora TaxID=4868 RepID=A0ACC1JH79_9FUNG|nr:protein disulfide-isomerase precursor [Linderina macrospora]
MKVNPMRFLLSTVAAFAFTGLAAASEDAAAADSDVHVLTTDTFKEWTAAQKLALVEFYAPWCGHCKALAPEYETAATTLKKEDIGLAKVDCTEEQALCEELEIAGFPTLKVFKDGDNAAYNGTRQADGIVSYMRKQLLPPLSDLTADNFDEFSKSDRVVVIGYVDDKESSEFSELDTLAKELRDEFVFGVVTDAKLAKKHGVSAPGVVVYKKFDDGKDVFDGKITTDSLREFVKGSSIPLLDDISAETYQMYAQAGLPLGFIFYDSEEMKADLTDKFYSLAKNYKGKISFVLIDATKYASQADFLNLKQEWPAFAIQNQASLAKFPFPQDQELDKKDLKAFVDKVVDGTAEPSYKSESIPETNDGNVFVLVSKQFNEIAFDETKDVLVEFYAPWCGHCKRLAPIYEKLGKVLKENKNLVIAKMDATANDVPSGHEGLQVQGFPTIKLISGKDNTVTEYNGNRSLESFIEFLEENAANKITYNKDDLKEEEDEDEEDEKPFVAEPKKEKNEAKEEVEAEAEAKAEEPKAEEPKAKESKAEDQEHDEL